MNDVARSVINKESSVEFAPVYDLYGEDDLYGKQLPDGTTDGATVDGTHATPAFYHRWTMRVLAAAERQLKTGCLLPGALDPTPRPVPESAGNLLRLRGAAPCIQRRRARSVPQSGLDARQPALADVLARARRGDAGHDAAGAAAVAPGA